MKPPLQMIPEYYRRYVEQIPDGVELVDGLKSEIEKTLTLVLSLSEPQLNFQYAPGKWTIKEILNHLTDAERIFSYRALRFARKDTTELPGFDEALYVPNSGSKERTIRSLTEEFSAVRRATIELFKNFNEEHFRRDGIASKSRISVLAIGYVILGHEIHHRNVIKERYLK